MKKQLWRLGRTLLSLVICICMLTTTIVAVNFDEVSGASMEKAPKEASVIKKQIKKVRLVSTKGIIVVGGTKKVKIKNAEKAEVKYKSNKKSVATVSKTGRLKGLRNGTAKIKVTVKKGINKTNLIYKITVKKPKISKKSMSLISGKTATLFIKNKPKKATYIWSSDNKKIATVDKRGKVTARDNGKAIIRVTVKTKNKKYNLSCNLEVKSKNSTPAPSVSPTPTSTSTPTPMDTATPTSIPTPTNKPELTDTPTPTDTSSPTNVPEVTDIPSSPDTPSKPQMYTVTFDSNGGSDVASQQIENGGKAIKPDDPTKNEYIFGGWYLDESRKEEFDFESTITGDIILYAKWNIDENTNLDLGKIEELVNNGDIEVAQNNDTSIRFIDGKFSDKKVENPSDALYILDKASPILTQNGMKVTDTVKEVEMSSEDEGSDLEENYYLFTMAVNGIPVQGSDIILVTNKDHVPTGLVNSYNEKIGSVDTNPDNDIENSIEDIIKNDISTVLTEKMEPEMLSALLGSLTFHKYLVVYAIGDDEEPSLAWKVSVTNNTLDSDGYTLDELNIEPNISVNEEINEELPNEPVSDTVMPSIGMEYYIAANGGDSGKIITKNSIVKGVWESTLSEGKDLKGVSQIFNCETQDGIYQLTDRTRKICTYQTLYNYGFFELKPTAILPGRLVKKGIFGWNKKAVSAHTNMAKVYDYYKDILKRESYDGHGAEIKSSIEYVEDVKENESVLNWMFNALESNAYWDSKLKQFLFCDAGGYEAALDACGHEYTHAVIDTKVGGRSDNGLKEGLYYCGESGALNESYADILGSLIEGKTGHDKWLIGEDGKALRNMSKPSEYNQPEHYNERYIGTKDDGGVHQNSGIFNFAAYKMMTDSRTSGISDETWAKIYYRSLNRLTSDATFLDASRAVISEAKFLGFTSEQQEAIHKAYEAVGIVEEDAIRIVLQWGARPNDLDSHLVVPTVDGAGAGLFHIYYNDKFYHKADGNQYAADLDYDYTSGYGKEIISIRALTVGDYYYYVHDYSNKNKSHSKEMSESQAAVKVYRGASNKILKTVDGQNASFLVDTTKDATLWNVLHIHIDESHNISIEPLNTYAYHREPSKLPDAILDFLN